MAKNEEESWIDNELIDNLRMRWIIRESEENSRVFVTQLEYTNRSNKKNAILRWDGAHGKYHVDIYGLNGRLIDKMDRRSYLPPISKQIDIVFNDLEENLFKMLNKSYHSALLTDIAKEAELFRNRLAEIKKNVVNQISSRKGLKLGTRHWGQHIKAKAKMTDSINIKLHDSEGNLKEEIKQ